MARRTTPSKSKPSRSSTSSSIPQQPSTHLSKHSSSHRSQPIATPAAVASVASPTSTPTAPPAATTSKRKAAAAAAAVVSSPPAVSSEDPSIRKSKRVKIASAADKEEREKITDKEPLPAGNLAPAATATAAAPASTAPKSKRRKVSRPDDMSSGSSHRHQIQNRRHQRQSEKGNRSSSARGRSSASTDPLANPLSRSTSRTQPQKPQKSMKPHPHGFSSKKGDSNQFTSSRFPRRQASDISMHEAHDDFFHDEEDDDYEYQDDYNVEEDPAQGDCPPAKSPPHDEDNNENEDNYDDEDIDINDFTEENNRDDDNDAGNNEDEGNMSAFQDDLFDGAAPGQPGGPNSLQDTLRMLSGFMSGTSSRLRNMLADLRRDDDPSLQLIALQELSDYLLVSNEDNLAGHFSPDAFVTELVKLMQPNPVTGEENPEIMLLACRSLANMMEALRGSIANVVYGGAVPVLCQKLLDIQFIDLAEQALDTLHKISGDFPGSIVKEGGLTACLTYLDFFPTSTQRTAVTTAANSCRNLSSHSFPVVKDVMPILLNVLKSNDQRVVEQGCTCVSRIVESFKRRPAKLEELIQPEMLKTVLGLLVPGTTNLIGPHVHTQLLRVVAHSARCSARLSGELLRMGVVDTLYQILTGVSPPAMDEDEESVSVSEGAGSSGVKNDSVRIMQSLIHLPQEQVYQALNVIVEALPPIPDDRFQPGNTAAAERVFNIDEIANLLPHRHHHSHHRHHHHHHTKTPAQEIKERVDMLSSLPQPAVRRFAKILFPTLTDTYASTVNQSVREKVLIAQMKMLLYLDPTTLESALKEVPYASFLASIFTQAQGMLYDGEADKLAAGPAGLAGQASLSGAPLAAVSASGYLVPVGYALQCAILLFERLPGVYLYQFQREGVVAQVERIARWEMRGERELRVGAEKGQGDEKEKGVEQDDKNVRADESKDKDVRMDDPVSEAEDNAEAREDESSFLDEANDDEDDDNDNDAISIASSTTPPPPPHTTTSSAAAAQSRARHHERFQEQVILAARAFLKLYESGRAPGVHNQALKVLDDLRALAREIEEWYTDEANYVPSVVSDAGQETQGLKLFRRLAAYFNDEDKMEGITSAELLESGIVRVLLDILGSSRPGGTASTVGSKRASFSADGSVVDARADFLSAFMGTASTAGAGAKSESQGSTAATPFSVLTAKLHDLLSRTEHFEVMTTDYPTIPSGSGSSSSTHARSSASAMLNKQLRLRLVADDAGEGNEREGEQLAIPKTFRNMLVSIHAIANFKTLDDYLRPRIVMADRPRAPLVSATRVGRGSGGAAGSSSRGDAGAGSGAGSVTGSVGSSRSRHQHGRDSRRGEEEDDEASLRRRSGRRHHQSAPPPPPPENEGEAEGNDDGDDRDDNEHDQHEERDELLDQFRFSNAEDEEDDQGDDLGPDEDDLDGLDAIVDDFEDDLSDMGMPGPGPADRRDSAAVNVEVGSGGKVTAKREDGTKVATPRTSTPASSSRPTAAQGPLAGAGAPGSSRFGTAAAGAEALFGLLGNSGRTFASYAAALSSIPQDWHLEFRINGQLIPNETTMYRAVQMLGRDEEAAESDPSRNVFASTHTVTFKRVPGPPSPEPSTLRDENVAGVAGDDGANEGGMPRSLSRNYTVASILQLLRALHSMNSQLTDIQAESKVTGPLEPEPLTQFINTKLTAKLNRQLEEPLIVASNCLPAWSEDLARQFPFLFPFETRHLFLQSTSFGYSRAVMRWQQADENSRRNSAHDDRQFFGRLQRQKVRISRARILESAHKVMDLYGSSPSVLEVEYFEEVGTGLGPTLEFYSNVSKEFSRRKLKMWREQDSDDASEYVFSKSGLFPAPMSAKEAQMGGSKGQLDGFKVLGKFVARSMLDSRIIDVPFSPTFFRIAEPSSSFVPTIGTIKSIDPTLANSLMFIKRFATAKMRIEQDRTLDSAAKDAALENLVIDDAKLEDLELDFTLPGYPDIELVPNGSNIPVTLKNVSLYIERVIDLTLGSGVEPQMAAFRRGFSQVFPYTALKSFTPDELVMLFGRSDEDWSIETLTDSMKADHGFNMDSKSVRNLLQTMSEFTPQQRRDFLQFVTGSPKLPIGGFRSLTPVFTVVCRPSEPPYTPDDYLPSVMTCVNYLKLPDYSSIEVLQQRLNVAMREGQGAFHLS